MGLIVLNMPININLSPVLVLRKSKKKSVGDLDENGMKLWNKYKVIQLKDILRKHKLPVSGAKAILITRLLKANIELD